MFRKLLIAVLVVAATTVPGSQSQAATAGDSVRLEAVALTAQPDPEMLVAMQRDLGLSVSGAVQRLGREQAAHGIDARVRKLAGSEFAGAWLEDNATVLRVGVTRRGLMPGVRAAGGTPVLARFRLSELEAASDRLKSVPFPGQSVGGWGVDIPTNRVVISHLPGGRAAAEKFAASGHLDADMVRYETRAQHRTGHAEVFSGRRYEGGDDGDCTLGFAVREILRPSTVGFLTAGHCARIGRSLRQQGGAPLGEMADSTFTDVAPGPDMGWIRVTSGDTTRPVILGDARTGFITVRGSFPAMHGASVCRRGGASFPSYACGPITATGLNEPLSFGAAPNRVVTGLTEVAVCSSPGDSGGPVITAEGQAQGIIIGNTVNLSCQTATKSNEMLFQPILGALLTYGLELRLPEPGPTALRIDSFNCDREQTGPGWVCSAWWSGGVDLANAFWQVPHGRPLPYVITEREDRYTEAHFACFFDEAEPDYLIQLTIRDAVQAQVRASSYICLW